MRGPVTVWHVPLTKSPHCNCLACHLPPPPGPTSNAAVQNIRKGEFSRIKVTGKRAIELGAGMGLAGLGLALLGEQTFEGGGGAADAGSERLVAILVLRCCQAQSAAAVFTVVVLIVDKGWSLLP